MSQDLFTASTIQWFRTSADAVLDHIHRLALPNSSTPPSDMFRPAFVPNANTQQQVPVAAERLIRWDTLHPNDAFWNGFQPSVIPSDGCFPDDAFNLQKYVSDYVQSIFVGTARYYRNTEDVLVRWEPLVTNATYNRFEYEIFAYGGIDVNHVLCDRRPYSNQHEIAFPGGIAREFIRTAREYNGTQLVRIWDNPRFDNTLNPAANIVPLESLPPPIRGLPVPVVFFTEHDGVPDPDSNNHGDAGANRDDLMRMPGDPGEDPTLNVSPTPRTSLASVLDPTNGLMAYFFCANRYVAITLDPNHGLADTIAWGPHDIVEDWPSLLNASFGNVDAILPDPLPNSKNVMYVFGMEKYARIQINPGTADNDLIAGPRTTIDGWSSLKLAGFNTVDAVLPVPGFKGQAYFFSGTKYVRVDIAADKILSGPATTVDRWASLKKAGFLTVDSALPVPTDDADAYFFSGTQYCRITVNPTGTDVLRHGPLDIATTWPSLHKAAFW